MLMMNMILVSGWIVINIIIMVIIVTIVVQIVFIIIRFIIMSLHLALNCILPHCRYTTTATKLLPGGSTIKYPTQ